jgi:hypothetical protein
MNQNALRSSPDSSMMHSLSLNGDSSFDLIHDLFQGEISYTTE